MKPTGIIIALALFVGITLPLFLSNTAPSPQIRTIRIAISTTPLSAPIIIAKQQGLFNRHNVNVELQPLPGGHLCFDAMINGDVDLATSSESVVMFNSFTRQDFRLLASFAESDNDLKLLTLHTDKNRNIAQLKHKKVGIVKASASEFFTDSLFIVTGQEDIEFKKIYMSAQALGPALLAKEVDAIAVWEPYGYRLFEQAGEDIYQYPSKGTYNLSFNLVSNEINSSLHFEQHVNILKALNEAQAFIIQSPELAKQIVSDYLNMSMAAVEWSWNDYIFRLSLNNSLLSMLQTQARWAVASEAVSKQPLPDFRLYLNDAALVKAINH